MCGIAGVLYAEPEIGDDPLSAIVKRMADTLIHRGPDDSGVWVDARSGIGLGHRRLSILDLSAAGHQPMVSANQRYVISYNGEIYNFLEIRAELEKKGVSFNGHSDTEVLLESIVHEGLDKTLEKLNGMFAFALWDKEERSLTLVRDRIGKKPLYYGWCGKTFLFGSELKALRTHPEFIDEIDRVALGQFIQYSWFHGPSTVYKSFKKLPPGTCLKVIQSSVDHATVPEPYWSLMDIAESGLESPFDGTFAQAANQLESLVKDSVGHRMIADVELGALLSGGIDSSLVVAMMQAQSTKKIKTFSIGFHEATHNEAVYAKRVAEYLGTDHTELYVTPQECMDVIPKLPDIYDEPLGDVSQIPTFIVSKLAHEQVKVVLSGDGGDELFAGYKRYFRCVDHWNKHEKVPSLLRPLVAKSMDASARTLWSLFGNIYLDATSKGWSRIVEKLSKRANRMRARNPLELFVRMMARCNHAEEIVYGSRHSTTIFPGLHQSPDLADPIHTMMLLDAVCYLPDDILVKVDRASMATSLEARCPLLDKNIIEFAWRLPFAMKVDQSGGKRILKALLSNYIPADLVERKKMGFGVPIGKWLRGPLKEWGENFLDPTYIKNQGYLNQTAVQKTWKQHQSGWYNHDEILWSILMFQAWSAENR